jgi:hypothetical protein
MEGRHCGTSRAGDDSAMSDPYREVAPSGHGASGRHPGAVVTSWKVVDTFRPTV